MKAASIFLAICTSSLLACGGGVKTPAATLAPASITFDGQVIGVTSDPQEAVFSNSGNVPLAVTSILISNPLFSQTNNCTTTMTTGQRCTITVTYTATQIGDFHGTLTVTDNATGTPHKIELKGTYI